MVEPGPHPYDFVNGQQLQQFSGKKIVIFGMVTNMVSSGLSFNIRTTDNNIIPMQVKRPIDSPVEGYVLVRGVSQGKSVLVEEFSLFDNEQFDARSHNKLCTFLYTVPNTWDIGEDGEDLDALN